jgi:hypothetical protein
VSYNASAVKIYNAGSSLWRLENKNIFFYYKKRSTYNAGVLAVNSKDVGLAPGLTLKLHLGKHRYNNFLNIPPYTLAGFDLTTHIFSLLDGRRRRYH